MNRQKTVSIPFAPSPVDSRLVDFLESTHDSFFTLDREWRLTYVNWRFCALSQRGPQELLGKDFWKAFPKLRKTPMEESYRRAMSNRLPVHFQAAGVYTDSWYEVAVYPTQEGIAVFSTDRSDEKRAIEQLRQSEARFKALSRDLELRNEQLENERRRWQGIVEGIADEVWVSDLQGRISLLNLGAVTPMGLEEFSDKSVEEILDEVEVLELDGTPRPADQSPLLRSLKGEIVRGEEIMRHRQTGKERYRRYSSGPMHDENGYITGSVVIVRDITEQKKIELQAETAHRETVEILESIGDAFYHLDQDWCFTYINQRSENLWGRKREDLIGKKIWEIFPQAVGSETYLAHVKVMEEREPLYLETISSIINSWISLSLYPATDGLSVYFRDISEQKKAEGAIKLSEQKFSLAFANNPAAIALTRLEDGIFLDVNATWEGLMGYSRKEVLGQSARKLSIWPSSEASGRFVQELKENGSLHWNEQEFQKKSGERFVAELVTQMLTINNEQVILSTFIDITERKRYQTELAEFTSKLQDSNRELQEFAYVASHDLQEPLRKVNSFGAMLYQKLANDLAPADKDQFDRLLKASARMQDMIRDLLELSRISTQGKPFQRVDLNQSVKEVRADLEVTLAKTGGKVEAGKLPTVKADPIQMERLLLNLIGNGLKYQKAGVPPLVRVTGKTIHSQGQECAEVRVQDNGIGFEMQYAERIFQPFQRLHGRSQYEGTGMGLAICKHIVERHSGKITVESRPGEGSTFTFTIPVK